MNPISAWNRFLFGPISARPLGAFRIVFGLLLLVYLAVDEVEFDYWYTGAGLLQGNEAREAAGPYRLSPLNYVHDPTIAHLFYAVTVAAAVGVTLGWRTRFMNVLLYLGMLSLYHRNVTANGGPDAVPMIMSFLLDALPERRGLFARRPSRGQEAGDSRRGLDRTVGSATAPDADLPALLSIVRDQVRRRDLDERHRRALRAVQSRVRPCSIWNGWPSIPS